MSALLPPAIVVALSSLVASAGHHALANMAPIGMVVMACDTSTPSQRWDLADLASTAGGRISLRAPQPAATSGFCLAVALSQVRAEDCPASAPNTTATSSRSWSVNATSHEIVSVGGEAGGQRLDLNAYGYNGPGSAVDLYKGTGAANQKWKYDPATGQIASLQTVWTKAPLCLAAVAIPLLRTPQP